MKKSRAPSTRIEDDELLDLLAVRAAKTAAADKRRPKYDLGPRFDYEIEEWIYRARPGQEPDAARNVLARFVNAIEAAEQPDQRLLWYLADSFREMLDEGSTDPRKPLGLIRGRAGNPGGVTTRVMTPDDKDELQQEVFKLFANGETQGEIERRLSKREIVPSRPARYVSRDTVRAMVRRVKNEVPKRKAELMASGAQEYDIADLLAREFRTDTKTMERVLFQLSSLPGTKNN
jgi:hypothetical protein